MKLDPEDAKFLKFSNLAIRKIGGIKHTIMSELDTGLLIQKMSRYYDSSIDLNKISNVMSHIHMIQNAEIGVDDQNNLEISINEFNKFKIFSTRSKNRVISVISDNRIQLGLVRMLLRQYY